MIRAEKDRRAKEAERQRLEQDSERIREKCLSLSGFVEEAWHVLEPEQEYVHNWHIDAITEHLQAITEGQINRLLVNVPPGSSKSLLCSVMWQAWEWGPMGRRSLRYLNTAYNDTPVKRDTRKCRDLILSDWYQSLWPEVELVRTAEKSFANSATGAREAIAFGSLTSQRGDRLVIDDPHSTETAESETDRENTTRKFREGAQNRLNDQKKSAILVVMQRLHEADISGVIEQLGMDYTHLMLPMEFEPARKCYTSIGFEDPRTADGDLLDPVRFPREEVENLKRDMGSYAYAGQYQQRPVPREGGLFKREWFAGKYLDFEPAGTVWVRHWDLAATGEKAATKQTARTAGVKMGITPEGDYVVASVVKGRFEGEAVPRTILGTAQADGTDVEVSLPQDPGQAGKTQAKFLIKMLSGFTARAEPETGDKVTRATPFAVQCEAGNVYLVKADWNEDYIAELCMFPGGAIKDQVDASSGAFGRLLKPRPATPLFGTYGNK